MNNESTIVRTGKIARLPRAVREEINRRLDENQTGETILAWLNPLPEVAKMGVVISAQNLSNWRLGGHQEWLQEQEIRARADDFAASAQALQGEPQAAQLGDHLAVVWLADFAATAQMALATMTDPEVRLEKLERCLAVVAKGRQDEVERGWLALEQEHRRNKYQQSLRREMMETAEKASTSRILREYLGDNLKPGFMDPKTEGGVFNHEGRNADKKEDRQSEAIKVDPTGSRQAETDLTTKNAVNSERGIFNHEIHEIHEKGGLQDHGLRDYDDRQDIEFEPVENSKGEGRNAKKKAGGQSRSIKVNQTGSRQARGGRQKNLGTEKLGAKAETDLTAKNAENSERGIFNHEIHEIHEKGGLQDHGLRDHEDRQDIAVKPVGNPKGERRNAKKKAGGQSRSIKVNQTGSRHVKTDLTAKNSENSERGVFNHEIRETYERGHGKEGQPESGANLSVEMVTHLPLYKIWDEEERWRIVGRLGGSFKVLDWSPDNDVAEEAILARMTEGDFEILQLAGGVVVRPKR